LATARASAEEALASELAAESAAGAGCFFSKNLAEFNRGRLREEL
jgi:hypothetical protein